MRKNLITTLGVLILGSFLLIGIARAAPVAFELPWWTIDNGGGRSTAGVYALNGTSGQPDVGQMSGGNFFISGGFWQQSQTVTTPHYIYLPLTLRNS
ncbi:MAG: hypothetical protein JXR84_00565 [Anaerolineae bacterium]|nr:hypothetical protein [Anaerolineae bacterium]